MKWFKSLKIRLRLIIGFGIVLFLLSAISILSRSVISVLNEATDDVVGNYDIMTQIKAREVDHLDWVMMVNRGVQEKTLSDLKVQTDYHKCKFGMWYYSDERKEVEKKFPEIIGFLKNIEEPHIKLHESVIDMKNVKDQEALIIYKEITLPSLEKVRSNILKINESVSKTTLINVKNLNLMSSSNKFILLIVFIIAALFGILFSIVITKSITSQLGGEPEDIKDIIYSLARGDFTIEIKVMENDHDSAMAGIKKMADDLEQTIFAIIVASQNLSQAVDQIASGNQNLSQRTSEQASSLEEIASTIEESTATINQNAENAEQANRQTEISSKLAQNGGTLVGEAVTSINEINQTSKKIGEIITVINEISFQTNLLALNAAVEAARAGEQGRGFAVVAGEVRNLAQRSGSAAKEIGVLIKEILEKIELGTGKANKSGEAINEVIESVKGVVKVMAEISAASSEQKQGINQINIAITEMDTMTQQNAALVEETASASEEMANQAQELLAMMQKFIIRDTRKSEVALKHKEIHLHSNDKYRLNKKEAEKNYDKTRDRNGFIKIESSVNGKKDMKSVLSAEGFEEF